MKASTGQTTKATISACAARLFRKRGYQATSMRDIAEAVEIKAASIYNHFSSKQEILSSLLLKMARLFTEGMRKVKENTDDPADQLEQLIQLHVRLTVEDTDAIALIAGEWIHLEAPELHDYLKLREAYEREFKYILDTGKANGTFRNIDTEIMLFSILSSLRWLYSWYNKNRDYQPEKLADQMISSLMGGIMA